MTFFINLDSNILLWIQEYLRFPLLTKIFIIITKTGDKGFIWIVLGLLLLCFIKTRKVGIIMLIALFCSFLINNVWIKNWIARMRPYEFVNGLEKLIEHQKDFSFPSGHTASSFAAAVVIFMTLPRKYGVLALGYASLIAFSRLYVGVHYPSDILVAIISGSLIAIAIVKFEEKTRKYNNHV